MLWLKKLINVQFKISFCATENSKIKKTDKRQCSQYLDWNPTCALVVPGIVPWILCLDNRIGWKARVFHAVYMKLLQKRKQWITLETRKRLILCAKNVLMASVDWPVDYQVKVNVSAKHSSNRNAVNATRCQYKSGRSSSEQVWTHFKEWPPDDISMWGSCTVRSKRGGGGWWAAVYGEVQCTMGNGHKATPCWQYDWLMDRHDVTVQLPMGLLNVMKDDVSVRSV